MERKDRTIKKIAIFDFDGTLIKTETPEVGKPRWEAVTGTPWPHKGWWGKAESLDIEVFHNHFIRKTVEAYKQMMKEENTLVVMMTGRRSIFSEQVEKILDKHKLVFDRKYYNTGGDTLSCKLKTLDSLMLEFPEVYGMEIWEDRAPHIIKFEEWCAAQKKLTFHMIHHVKLPTVINLLGSPGTGKSTTASALFALMKWNGYSVELAPEYAKDLVWEKRFTTLENQIYVFGKQHHRVHRLTTQVDYIITDSPLILSQFYNEMYGDNSKAFSDLVISEIFKNNTINILLNRVKPYVEAGRNQTESEAGEFHHLIHALLNKVGIDYQILDASKDAADFIFDLIKEREANAGL